MNADPMMLPLQTIPYVRTIRRLACLIALVSLSALAQRAHPGVTFDLHAEGYFDLPKDFQYLAYQAANGQISFVAPDCVAVSFLVKNAHPGVTGRESLAGGRWLFQTLVIDIDSGRLKEKWAWRTATPDAQFVSLANGTYLVSSDERISVNRADGQMMSQLDLPMTTIFPVRPYATAIVSNSGNTLFMVSDKDKTTQTVDVYRTSDLNTKTTFTIPYQSLITRMGASDEGLLYMGTESPASLFIDHFGLASDKAWTCQAPWKCGLQPQFIGTDRLLLNDGPHTLLLVGDQGTLLRKRELDQGEEISRVSVCSDGSRVMLMLLKMGGGSTFFDIFPKVKAARIAIFETGTLKEVASLAVDPKHLSSIRAGINPSGDLVAYMDDGTLKFWRVSAPKDER